MLLLNMSIGLTNYSVTVSYSGLAPHFGLTSGSYFFVLTPTHITNISAVHLSYLKINSTYLLVNPLTLNDGSRLDVTYQGGNATFVFTLIIKVPQEPDNVASLEAPQYMKIEHQEKMGSITQEYVALVVSILSFVVLGAVRVLERSRRRA